MPVFELRDAMAPEGVLRTSSVVLENSPEEDSFDPLTKAIKEVPWEWFPPPLNDSALSPGLSGDGVSSPVASAWQEEAGEPGGSASAPGERLLQNNSGAFQCSYSVCTGQATNVSSDSHPENSVPQPGTSAQVASAQHSLYKLPRVDASVRLAPFSTESAFSFDNSLKDWETFAMYIRSTLSKESLSEKEASGLLRIAERLAGHMYYFQRTPVADLSPANAVPVLGTRYLLLESLMDASYVLGEAMQISQWWHKLIARIPSRVVFTPQEYPQRRCQDYARLALKLSSAIEVLKQGLRLEPAEAALLKEELLCQKTCHRALKRRNYDCWRCLHGKAKGDNAD